MCLSPVIKDQIVRCNRQFINIGLRQNVVMRSHGMKMRQGQVEIALHRVGHAIVNEFATIGQIVLTQFGLDQIGLASQFRPVFSRVPPRHNPILRTTETKIPSIKSSEKSEPRTLATVKPHSSERCP